MVSTIGVLGGMGPESTNKLCALITALTPAHEDQQHIPVITFNNPHVPSRVNAILQGGESPVPEMVRTAKVLENAGADFIVIPCNIAHYYMDEVQKSIQIPIISMVEETVKFILVEYPHVEKIGILASTPTIECRIYQKPLSKHNRILVVPDAVEQESKVMEAIYGSNGIKAGHKTQPRSLLEDAAQGLKGQEAEIIISGCTEVSLVMIQKESPFIIIDPMEIIAKVAVNRALSDKGDQSLSQEITRNYK